MKKALLAALLVVAALLALACGEGGGEIVPAVALKLELDTPSGIHAGDTVSLKLTVENTADSPVQFSIGGTAETNYVGGYDFVVTDGGSSEVWAWLKSGVSWEPILSAVILQPGARMQFEQDWSQEDLEGRPVEPGTYLVRAVLTGETEGGQAFELRTVQQDLVISP